MKKVYKSPSIKLICGVCDSLLMGSQDIKSISNNPENGGYTMESTMGINYGDDWTGGSVSEGDLDD